MNESELIEKLSPYYKQLGEFQRKKDVSFYNLFKNITTLSLGLLGLLIGLKPKVIPDENAKVLFLLALILLALVCVFSLITQFGETSFYKIFVKETQELMKEIIRNKDVGESKLLISRKKWIYKFSEIMTYLCLILSIGSLIFYVYFLEF